MELRQKIQELRKQRGLTQEELAAQLYVSRTAVSKWESGRGYPNIDSLKVLAKFFSVSLDDLLSADELLTVAEKTQIQEKKRFLDLVFGLLDVSALLLLFLPLFAERSGGTVVASSLLALSDVPPWLKLLLFVAVIGSVLIGILLLALQGCEAVAWQRCKIKLSLGWSVLSVLLLVLSLHPYAAVFAFSVLAIKTIVLIMRR